MNKVKVTVGIGNVDAVSFQVEEFETTLES